MSDFFKGWRRKTGMVTLVLACAFMGGWVRSRSTYDAWAIPSLGRVFGLQSKKTEIYCTCTWLTAGGDISEGHHWPRWSSFPIEPKNPNFIPFEDRIHSKFRLGEFEFVRASSDYSGQSYIMLTLPYWSAVLPLTILSAFLLLTKPRPLPLNKIPDPTTVEGT